MNTRKKILLLNGKSNPRLISASLAPDGETYTFIFSKPVTADTAADLVDFTLEWSATGAITFTYVSGDGITTITATGSAIVNEDETIVSGLNYTPGSIVDLHDNALVAFSGKAVVNRLAVSSGGTYIFQNGSSYAFQDGTFFDFN